MTSPDFSSAASFKLEVDGVQIGTIRKVGGFGSENEVIDFKHVNEKGKPTISKIIGALKWENITIEAGYNPQLLAELNKWRKEVYETGDLKAAKRHGAIVMYDSKGEEIGRIEFTDGWPAKLTPPEYEAGSNEVAQLKLEIAHHGVNWA